MFNWFSSVSKEPMTLGRLGEQLAQLEYKKRGYSIVAANFYNEKGKRVGEIDFIATDKNRIVFVEVKTRTEEKGFHGTPAEAVDHFKQIKLLKAVKLFLLKNPKFSSLIPQIDVAAIIVNDFSHLPAVSRNPAKYQPDFPLDKLPFRAIILSNAVEDWN